MKKDERHNFVPKETFQHPKFKATLIDKKADIVKLFILIFLGR